VAADAGHAMDREQLLDEVVAAYLEAVESGCAPDRGAWLARYPELAAELAAFFADQDQFDSLVAPLRTGTPSPTIHRPTHPGSETPRPEAGVRASSPQQAFGDYEVLEEIARGGMGVVYRARQLSLNRTVALKMIRSGQFAFPEEVQRFRLEAEAAANLDHPHIIPIYEIGTHEGRHYFSMKLIEGGSLAQRILDFRLPAVDPATGKDETGRVWSRPEISKRKSTIVNLMVQVARAVDYAHQRGLLHRDLKPANILIDAEGHPHITDFGLAKRLRPVVAPQIGNGRGSQAAREDHGEPGLTQSGIAVGTPTYMAPEQAGGPKGSLTTAADIYSLGAILYFLLTGRPPFRGETPLETLAEVLEHEPARPRSLCPSVDRDLETICLKCLDKDPAKRYPSALALAEDLERFQAGEPIQARPVTVAERFRRWCRRNPALAAASSLAVLSLVAAAIVFMQLFINEGRHAAELLDRQRETEHALDVARRHDREARQQKREAEESFQQAHKAVDEFCIRLSTYRLDNLPGLQPLRKDLLEAGLKYYEGFLKKRGEDPAISAELGKIHFRIADITWSLGSPVKALTAYERAVAIFQTALRRDPANVAVEADLARACINMGLLQNNLGKDRDAMRSFLQAHARFTKLGRLCPNDPHMQAGLGASCTDLGLLFRANGDLARARDFFQEALRIQEELARKHPRSPQFQAELALGRVNVGVIYSVMGKEAEALALFEAARPIQEKLVASRAHRILDDQRDLALNYRRIGTRLCNNGRVREGRDMLDRGHALLEELAKKNPSVTEFQSLLAVSHRYLAHSYENTRDLDKAYEHYRLGGRILEKLASRQKEVWPIQNDLAVFYYHGGRVQLKRGQRKEGLIKLRLARSIHERVVRANPDNMHYRVDLSAALHQLGKALQDAKQSDAALAVLRQAVDHQYLAVVRAPLVTDYVVHLNEFQASVAAVLRTTGRSQEGLRALLQTHALLEGRVQAEPRDRRLQKELAGSYDFLTTACQANGDHERAFRYCQQARAIQNRLGYVDPRWTGIRCDEALTVFRLAGLSASRKRRPEELGYYRKSKAILEKLVEIEPKNTHFRSNLCAALNNLGVTLEKLNQLKEGAAVLRLAVKHQKEDIRLAPQQTHYRRSLLTHYGALAEILRQDGQFEEALAVTEERRQAAAGNSGDLFFVARDLLRIARALGERKPKDAQKEAAARRRRCDLAVAVLREAVAAGYKGVAGLKSHPDFAMVRDHEGFKTLVAQTTPKEK
jgi:serine/threonine-protein kinase